MAKKEEHQINLLPQEEFDASTLGRTVKWLQGTFRYLVITTEMVVMVAFLSRFWLDAKSNDLIDAINQKKVIVSSYSTFEKQFRDAQKQISIFKSYSDNNLLLNPVIAAIAANIPPNVVLTEVIVDKDKVSVLGQSADEGSASSFVANLMKTNLLTNVDLASAESKKDATQIDFKITANLDQRGINVY